MDPLSITTGALAVATLAAQIGSAFANLRALCIELPGRLYTLKNEVADIEVVLYQVAKAINQRSNLPKNDETALPELLEQAMTKLTDLKKLVDYLVETCNHKRALIRVATWRKEQPRLQALQEDIKTIKCSLNIILGASNSRDMIRVRLDLEALSTVTVQSAQEQTTFRDEFLSGLVRQYQGLKESINQHYSQVDQRISRVEEMLKAQAAQLQASQSTRIDPFEKLAPPPYRRRLSRICERRPESGSPARAEGLGVRLTQRMTCYRSSCCCACHSQRKSATSRLVDRVLGQLFIGYAGLPLISPHCDIDMCDKGQIPFVNVEYWFPLGFCWSWIIRLQLAYQSNIGPHMQLSTLRRVPDSAKCVSFALAGNINGLKNLFRQGLASPRDVSSTRGYSLLRWALYGQQYETCKFLVNAGADSQYSPISPHDECPANRAHEIVLCGGLSKNVVEILRCLTEGNDFIEKQNFSPLHKIVLNLSLGDLEESILQDLDCIDIKDAMGRTALGWAAARGDERSVRTLLRYGADPNTMDKCLNTPLLLASDKNHTICVRLLLEAGANPDPAITDGTTGHTALHHAARNASDRLLLKTLLEFNANIEASTADGITPLLEAARSNSAGHAMLLLEYGADINATSKDGRTPLTTTIIYNNHSVLQLLLDWWFEYCECPHLEGPHLLDLVAQYADLKTMSILASASHLKLKFDRNYLLGDFVTRLQERLDVTDKMIAAFEDLLAAIGHGSEPGKSIESHNESGLLTHQRPNMENDDDSSDQSFEDAMEYLAIDSSDHNCSVYLLKKRATI